MKDKLIAFFFSTRTMAVLMIGFAAAMAFGTFIENSYDTPTSKIWVYNTWWFSLIMLWLMANFIYNIKRYQLLQWKKWAVLLLHISWVLIIIGAGITRYISYEGMMLIREGETEKFFFSESTYFSAIIQGKSPDGQDIQRTVDEKVLISPYDYDIETSFEYFNDKVTVTIDSLLYDAVEGLVPVEEGTGDRYLTVVEAGSGSRHDHLIKDGEKSSIHGVLFGVNIDPEIAAKEKIINITENWNGYTIQTPYEGEFLRMADQMKGTVIQDSIQPLQLRSLYTTAGLQFVIPNGITEGRPGIVQASPPTKAKAYGLFVTVSDGIESKKMELLGGKGMISDYENIQLGDKNVYLKYGSKQLELPFSVTLDDFVANKYPGTENGYSSFESYVTVNDESGAVKEHIYMNNVLDKEGYRFFQAGFDPDELGTHLSVNHDWWGTNITYLGYYLLYIGLLGLLFSKHTRFAELGRLVNRVVKRKAKMATTIVVILFSISGAIAQDNHAGHDHETNSVASDSLASVITQEAPPIEEVKMPVIPKQKLDSIIVANMVPEKQAEMFGRLVAQDDGRMKPISTLSSEILRRLSEKEYYEAEVGDSIVKLTPEQTLLSMMQLGQLWFEVPIIKLKRGNDSIRDLLGIDRSRKFASGTDFFRRPDDTFGSYKLSRLVDEANAADIKTAQQNNILDLNFSTGILNETLSGNILKIFPGQNTENNKWYSPIETEKANYQAEPEKEFAKNFIPAYLTLLNQGKQTGNYLAANAALNGMFEFQKQFGGDLLPSQDKIEAEIFYNKHDIFKNLYKWYGWFGLLMLLLLVAEILKPMKQIRWSINFHHIVIIGLFLAHTAGLVVRWYLSGHAPWSDAYESLIYVAWATMGMGLLLSRKSQLIVAGAAFVVAIILWVAQLNWLDPSISNLQPVLDSYWLMIHVAVIVGSYGPFALGMILGLIALILMIVTTEKNKKRIDLNIKELTYLNEVVLTIGIIMLTIGNFLGGMWANESWGRYWGWDPKETWALISIFIYAFVLHLRLIPGLKGRWTYNLWSVLAFGSILFTYFGVNFYLSGLHSYASGDQILSYKFIVTTLAVVLAIGFLARWKEMKHFKRKQREME
ncbi:MAG: cytochrome c biogenesis protein CcsA [Bacteroidota bacterium]|nr:cytochrome c biogenesis protein CcsA [Bacteroidota bacterium]